MAKAGGRQKTNTGGKKSQKATGQPRRCDAVAGSGACKKRRANALQKRSGVCLSCNAG